MCAVLFSYLLKAAGNYQQPVWIVAAMVMIAATLFLRKSTLKAKRLSVNCN